MDKLWPTLLILVVVALVFVGMWAGWRRIRRRDATLSVPTSLAQAGDVTLTVAALHLATTRHDAPLDRVVVPGLGYRANATVTVSSGGVTITAPGEQAVAIATSSIVGAGAATWTIDHSVEPDGLSLIAWRAERTDGDSEVLDTYLRVVDPAEQSRLLAGIRSIVADDANRTTSGADDVAIDPNTGDEA